jgi:hypothetical protein
MKTMTDRELLDAVDRAMKIVVGRFKARREAAVQAEHPSPPRGTDVNAAAAEAVLLRGGEARANSDADMSHS